jgi:hypothetical protein
MVLLFGVKTTLNKLAVKLELSWQAFRELDSISLMACVPERRERSEKKKMRGENVEDLMVAVYVVTDAVAGRGGKRSCCCCPKTPYLNCEVSWLRGMPPPTVLFLAQMCRLE